MTTTTSTSSTLQPTTTNYFVFLYSSNFWAKAGTGLLFVLCVYFIYNLLFSPRRQVTNNTQINVQWTSAYGSFLNGVVGFNLNGAAKPFAISYPVMNNKQVGIRLATIDGTLTIFLGFNEVSALIDTIANSYYDPNLQSITDLSAILAQTKLTVPARVIQNDQIVDTNTGSYTIWFSLDAKADTIMNITSSTTSVNGSSISVTPKL